MSNNKIMGFMKKLHIILLIFLLFGCTPEIKVNNKKGGSGKKNIEQKSLKIAAFNTKTFGTKKSSDPDILKRIIQIIEKYDIILLQEIRNKNLDAVIELHNKLIETSPSYDYKISEPIGRSSYKEQYAYFFNTDIITPLNEDIYPDSTDHFEREPYIIHFKIKDSDLDLALIGTHIKPGDAVKEVEKLDDVYDYAKNHFNEEDAFILGDLNSDCSYMSDEELDQAFFNTDNRFKSFIDRHQDTTATSTDCAYDRIIGTKSISSSVQEGSAKVFNFTESWGLTQEEGLKISDHYPVEITLNYWHPP